MIYTLTLNPALDRSIVIKRFVEDDTIRVLEEQYYAAGKGIDVSRVIKELGGQSVSLGFVGGYHGLHLEGLLINAGVMTNFTRIAGETRTNLIIKEQDTGIQYIISAAGPEVSAAEIGELYNQILSIHNMDYFVMSGSLPRGITPNLYAQLILAGKRKNAVVFLDTDGKALKESINYQPDGIKPNKHELSRLMERDIEKDHDVIRASDILHKKGIRYVLTSLGKEGLFLSTEDYKIKAIPPEIETDSTVGAGDSALAGFILSLSQGKDLKECLTVACAAGTATVLTPGTELCHREDVERLKGQIQIVELS